MKQHYKDYPLAPPEFPTNRATTSQPKPDLQSMQNGLKTIVASSNAFIQQAFQSEHQLSEDEIYRKKLEKFYQTLERRKKIYEIQVRELKQKKVASSKPAAPAKKDDDDDIDLFGSDDKEEETGKLQLPIVFGLDLLQIDCKD